MDCSMLIAGQTALDRGWTLIALSGKGTINRRPGVWDRSTIHGVDELNHFVYKGCNLGVRTGHSGLVVVDIDPSRGGYRHDDYAPTLEVRSGCNGTHLYYQDPGVDLMGKDGAGVDIKAANSYVVIPPGWEGRPYEWVNHLPIAEMPGEFIDRLTKRATTSEVAILEPTGADVGTWWRRPHQDRSGRDFKLACEMLRSGESFQLFVSRLRSLPQSWDKGRNNFGYYEDTWRSASAEASTPRIRREVLSHTPVPDMSVISNDRWPVDRDARQMRTDQAVAAWLIVKSAQLGCYTFRVAVVEIAAGVHIGREAVGKSLHRLHDDGMIRLSGGWSFDPSKGKGIPRKVDVSPLATG